MKFFNHFLSDLAPRKLPCPACEVSRISCAVIYNGGRSISLVISTENV